MAKQNNTAEPEAVEPIETVEPIEPTIELEPETVEPVETNDEKLKACFEANPNIDELHQTEKDGQCFEYLNHAEVHQKTVGGLIKTYNR